MPDDEHDYKVGPGRPPFCGDPMAGSSRFELSKGWWEHGRLIGVARFVKAVVWLP